MSGARARGEAADGVVVAFDRDEGLGQIRLASGQVVAFHATQLRDGTRDVAVGRAVRCRVLPWHRGALEATAIEPA